VGEDMEGDRTYGNQDTNEDFICGREIGNLGGTGGVLAAQKVGVVFLRFLKEGAVRTVGSFICGHACLWGADCGRI
jgi:hypothetical protein